MTETASYKVLTFPGKDLPAAYKGVVLTKWQHSLRYGNEYFKLIDPIAYYPAYHRYIERILNDENAVIRLAVLSDDPDVVLGFSVTRLKVLDFVHVLRIKIKTDAGFEVANYRQQGIGRSLVPPNIDTITHLTKTGLIIWANKYPHWKFNPFA